MFESFRCQKKRARPQDQSTEASHVPMQGLADQGKHQQRKPKISTTKCSSHSRQSQPGSRQTSGSSSAQSTAQPTASSTAQPTAQHEHSITTADLASPPQPLVKLHVPSYLQNTTKLPNIPATNPTHLGLKPASEDHASHTPRPKQQNFDLTTLHTTPDTTSSSPNHTPVYETHIHTSQPKPPSLTRTTTTVPPRNHPPQQDNTTVPITPTPQCPPQPTSPRIIAQQYHATKLQHIQHPFHPASSAPCPSLREKLLRNFAHHSVDHPTPTHSCQKQDTTSADHACQQQSSTVTLMQKLNVPVSQAAHKQVDHSTPQHSCRKEDTTSASHACQHRSSTVTLMQKLNVPVSQATHKQGSRNKCVWTDCSSSNVQGASTGSTSAGLPEKLGGRPLRLIIVGHNPSAHAWQSGHYYSNPGNRMWGILKTTGIAPARDIRGAVDDDKMPVSQGVGFTDVGAGVPGTQSAKFRSADFIAWRTDFYERLRQHVRTACAAVGCTCGRCGAPVLVAFSGKRHFMELLNAGRRGKNIVVTVETGLQPRKMLPSGWPLPESTEVWVMTSTSGASALTNAAREAPWMQLSQRLQALPWPRGKVKCAYIN